MSNNNNNYYQQQMPPQQYGGDDGHMQQGGNSMMNNNDEDHYNNKRHKSHKDSSDRDRRHKRRSSRDRSHERYSSRSHRKSRDHRDQSPSSRGSRLRDLPPRKKPSLFDVTPEQMGLPPVPLNGMPPQSSLAPNSQFPMQQHHQLPHHPSSAHHNLHQIPPFQDALVGGPHQHNAPNSNAPSHNNNNNNPYNPQYQQQQQQQQPGGYYQPPAAAHNRAYQPPHMPGFQQQQQHQQQFGGMQNNNNSNNNTLQQRQARRIYVGNIPRDMLIEEEIIGLFNMAMRSTHHVQGESVIGIQVNHEKNFVFLDFRTPQEATLAMSLDGIKMRDQMLKVRRPNNYVPPQGGEIHVQAPKPTAVGLVSTTVVDSPNKLFIGGLPSIMTEEKVLELLQNIGTVNAFNLVKDMNTGVSKGYAFCEFASTEITDKAIQLLNGLDMGGKKLIMQRSSVGKQNTAATASSSAMGSYTNADDPNAPADPFQGIIFNFLNLGVKIDQTLATLYSSNQVKVESTPVLVLLNITSMRDLIDDMEYDDLFNQIQHEAKHFGFVKKIVIPRPDKAEISELVKDRETDYSAVTPMDDNNKGIGKVFIEFDNPVQAERAQKEFAGRKFQGRTCITTFHLFEDFVNNKF